MSAKVNVSAAALDLSFLLDSQLNMAHHTAALFWSSYLSIALALTCHVVSAI